MTNQTTKKTIDIKLHRMRQTFQHQKIPTRWSSGKTFVSGAGILRFKSRTSQIGRTVANGSPPLQPSSNRAVLPAGPLTWRWVPQIGYTLRRNTASIMKDLI